MTLENTSKEQEDVLYQANKKEQDDIDYALSFRDSCFNQTRKERARWRQALERYNLSRDLSEYDYIKDIHLGLTYDAVERVSAALPGREFGFRGKPVGPEDVTNALLFSEALSNAWNAVDVMDGPSKMQVVKRSMALFGSCPVQLYWDVKIDSAGNVLKSDPGFYPLNIFNFYANKFHSEIEDCPEAGYITELSLSDFQNTAKALGYKNWKKVKGINPGKSIAGGQDLDSESTDAIDNQSATTSDKLNVVKIFEVQSNDFILTIALDDNPVWLRKVPNALGMKNCVMFRYKRQPVPNRLYGITDIERGGELEDSIQIAFNQMAFNHLLVDNPGFTYNKLDKNIDPRTFVMAPGAGIPRGQDPNALTPIQFDSHLGESASIIGNMLERYKRLVNVPDILSGVSDKGVDSATESNILDANTKASFESIVGEMKSTMYRVAVLLRKMYEVYGPESLTVSVRTPELKELLAGQSGEISKEAFLLKRDVDIVVDFTTQNKGMLSRNLVAFLQIAGQDPMIPPALKLMAYQQWLQLNDLEDLAQSFDSMINKKQTSDTAQADQENQQMANGQALPPTAGATPAHTQRHVEFMRSTETGPEIDRILKPHIEGEIAGLQNAQQGGSPSAEGGDVPMESMTPEANTMTQ